MDVRDPCVVVDTNDPFVRNRHNTTPAVVTVIGVKLRDNICSRMERVYQVLRNGKDYLMDGRNFYCRVFDVVRFHLHAFYVFVCKLYNEGVCVKALNLHLIGVDFRK